MKKLFLFLMILAAICVVAVSCGADKTPAETTPNTSVCGLETTEAPVADTTATPDTTTSGCGSISPDTTQTSDSAKTPDTTKTPNTTETPATTKPWGDLIPIQ